MVNSFRVCILILILTMFCACGDAKKEEQPEPAKVRVIPEAKTVEVGQSAVFKAVVLSSEGDEMAGVAVTWKVEGDAGTVDEAGKFIAEKPGEATLLASTMGITGRGRITVPKLLATAPVEHTEAVGREEEAGADIPESILIQNEGYANDRKGPVSFSHLSHTEDYEVACQKCHHVYKDGENIWQRGDSVQKCRECHSPNEKDGDALKLGTAYHRNCKNCHKELMQEGISENAPWKKCAGCHAKGL